jgi:hypothetical protein
MLSQLKNNDEQAAAKLLWQLKAIATKEVEKVNLPYSCIDSFYIDPMNSSEGRGRTVSIESVDTAIDSVSVSPVLSYISKAYDEGKSSLLLDNSREKSIDHLDHHDWGSTAPKTISCSSLISKRKRQSHIGLTTKSGIIRCTLRKKVSSYSVAIVETPTIHQYPAFPHHQPPFFLLRFDLITCRSMTHSSHGSNTQK